MLYYIKFLVGFLLHYANTLYVLAIYARAAIEDGDFRSVYFNEAIINRRRIESSHGVFDCRYLDIALFHDRTTVGADDIFCDRVDYRLIGKVDTLNLVAVILGRRTEFGFNFKSGMKALAFDYEGIFKS